MTEPRERITMPDYLERLNEWARPMGLEIRATSGSYREPENIVSVKEPGGGPVLVSKTSHDSCAVAAMYVVHTLERLGVTVP